MNLLIKPLELKFNKCNMAIPGVTFLTGCGNTLGGTWLAYNERN